MMGRGSDTRIYAPRSESSHMFRANHEDERTPTGMEDARDKEARMDKRQKKKEAEEKEDRKIRHIKVRRHHMGLDDKPEEGMEEEESPFKPRSSPSEPTQPAGAGGFLTSLAAQAKGPGAAAGQLVQMSEPMKHAWSSLLKQQVGETPIDGVPHVTWMSPQKITGWINGRLMLFGLPEWAARNEHTASISGQRRLTEEEGANSVIDSIHDFDTVEAMKEMADEQGNLKRSEPMKHAWSALLKMSEAEALHYHRPENEVERVMARKRAAAGHGRLRGGLSQKVRQDAVAAGQRNVDAGIPSYLRFAHHTHPEMIRQRGMVPDKKIPLLPITAEERSQIADLRDVANSANMRPQTLYHRQAYANTMLPPGPFGKQPPEPEPQPLDIQDSPIPGMAFVNGQLVNDPRIKNAGTPMEHARSEILKYDRHDELYELAVEAMALGYADNWEDAYKIAEQEAELTARMPLPYEYDDSIPDPEFDPQWQQKNASEPMKHAWSEILKSKRKSEKRRKKEQRAKWRPSTGKFKRPRGGYTGRSGTSARAKLLSRNLPMGRKTGLMRPHLSVEMSHRGIASKQPMSKDPQAYGQWRGYQEQQNIRGQIAPQSGASLPFGQISMPRAPRPRLHPVRAPPIQPPRLRRPRLNRPKMPGMVTMSEDPVPDGDLLKARTNHYLLAEARTALREMRQLMRQMKDKDSKKKNMGAPDTAGAASTLPKYPGNNPKQTTRGEGGTEDENDPRTWGLDPIGQLVGRGGNRA